MANIKSNEKSIKQYFKKNLNNKSLKNEIKTAIKKAQLEKNSISVDNAVKLINSAVAKGAFHKNKGARLVSKIQLIIIAKDEPTENVVSDEKKPEVDFNKEKCTSAKCTAKKQEADKTEKPVAKPTASAAKKPAAKKPAAKKPVAKTTTAKKPVEKK